MFPILDQQTERRCDLLRLHSPVGHWLDQMQACFQACCLSHYSYWLLVLENLPGERSQFKFTSNFLKASAPLAPSGDRRRCLVPKDSLDPGRPRSHPLSFSGFSEMPGLGWAGLGWEASL